MTVQSSKNQFLKNNLHDEELTESICEQDSKYLEERARKNFKGIYQDGINAKSELLVVVCCLAICLIIPVNLWLRLTIGLCSGAVVEFLIHKGHRFIFTDLVTKFQYKDDIVYKTPFSLGKFKPVIIGVNEFGKIEVRDSLNKDSHGKLKDCRVYIADKETIGDMVFRYIRDDPLDFSVVVQDLVKEIDRMYVQNAIINSDKLEKLKGTGYFSSHK